MANCKLNELFNLKCKNICINIKDFTEIMVNDIYNKLWEASPETVKNGLYGITISKTNIYVDKTVNAGYIKISDKENPEPKSPNDWSPIVLIEKSGDLLNLKMFW
jgi:hypothetical protein